MECKQSTVYTKYFKNEKKREMDIMKQFKDALEWISELEFLYGEKIINYKLLNTIKVSKTIIFSGYKKQKNYLRRH